MAYYCLYFKYTGRVNIPYQNTVHACTALQQGLLIWPVVLPGEYTYEEQHEEPGWVQGLGRHEVDDHHVDQRKYQLEDKINNSGLIVDDYHVDQQKYQLKYKINNKD